VPAGHVLLSAHAIGIYDWGSEERCLDQKKNGDERASVTKVLQILHHSLTPFELGVGPKFYEGDWHVRVAKELAKRTSEYEIECWRPEKSFNKVFSRKDKEGITYKIFPSTSWSYGLEFSLPLLRNLKSEFARNEKILVHLHGLYNLHVDIISAFVGERCPIVIQSHGGSPTIFEIKRDFRGSLRHPLRFPLVFAERVSLGNIDQFFVLSKEEEEYFSNKYGSERARIQPMGIDVDKFKPIQKDKARERLGLRGSAPYALYVGRIHETKGLSYLIEAMKLIIQGNPDLKLILVGDGPHRARYQAMSRALGIEKNVMFKGWVKPDELLLYYGAADMFVFPTLEEPWGIVILEALACKKPVITTFSGCVPKLIDELKEGLFVVPKRDALGIKKAMLKVLPDSEEVSRRINSEKLRKYGWDEIIKNTVDTYEKLLGKYLD
jgi:glycosyltransferase involved in cell wall biosynthesis